MNASAAHLLAEGKKMERAMRLGVREALRQHKLAGQPICEWRDGKVVWIAAKDIEVSIRRRRRRI